MWLLLIYLACSLLAQNVNLHIELLRWEIDAGLVDAEHVIRNNFQLFSCFVCLKPFDVIVIDVVRVVLVECLGNGHEAPVPLLLCVPFLSDGF